jgi:primosomal protein N' (replication factor Y)
MSTYYVCPLGMVFSAMVPAAVKHGTGQRDVEHVRLTTLGEQVRGGTTPEPALGRAAKTAWKKLAEITPVLVATRLKDLLEHLEIKSPKGLRDLGAAGLLEFFTQSEIRAHDLPSDSHASSLTQPLTPTPEQGAAITGISAALPGFGVHLIRGVTGSGKTEVYLQLMDRVLAGGGTCIVLVPEISLTPQTSDRFVGRLGRSNVAVLHSGLTNAQRNREWNRVASGQARVVVGARSAVFAPVRHLGLIVVDEEHDSSYKQDQLPRYNARDVAIKRAHIEKAAVVLGSATPSLESWHNAQTGKFRLWQLTQRAGQGQLPDVQVVDLRVERRLRASDPLEDKRRIHSIGPTLERAIEHALQLNEQIVLLLNRRGFAHYIACPDPVCGYIVACDMCDANLVLHRGRNLPAGELIRCHHCLQEQLVPVHCPTCRKKLNPFGGGTQRVEEELLRKFAAYGLDENSTLRRLDSDTMRTATDYFEALQAFGEGRVRVLLGTQMIAKGLDFPGVTLVGVIDADTSLSVADFRAEERSFQLLSQVAGRAGRAGSRGHVIIQTNNPNLAAIQFASSHDYVGFAEHELQLRAHARLPPLSRMARLVCRDENVDKAAEQAAVIARFLRSAGTDVLIDGPAPCSISRIAGYFRYEVLLNAASTGKIQALLQAGRQQGLIKSDSTTAVDVDPVSLS